jgi:hypothetical protein
MSVPFVNTYLDIRSCGIANVADNTYTTVYTPFSWYTCIYTLPWPGAKKSRSAVLCYTFHTVDCIWDITALVKLRKYKILLNSLNVISLAVHF